MRRRIKIFKRAHENPIVLKNGDRYDGLLEIYDYNNIKLYTCRVNTDPTINYKGGEIAAGKYLYEKRYRRDGKIVFQILDSKNRSDILPSIKPNPNHGGKNIIQAVQIHVGGISWDGSHGCLTIHPSEWWGFLKNAGDNGELEVLEATNNKNEKGKKDVKND